MTSFTQALQLAHWQLQYFSCHKVYVKVYVRPRIVFFGSHHVTQNISLSSMDFNLLTTNICPVHTTRLVESVGPQPLGLQEDTASCLEVAKTLLGSAGSPESIIFQHVKSCTAVFRDWEQRFTRKSRHSQVHNGNSALMHLSDDGRAYDFCGYRLQVSNSGAGLPLAGVTCCPTLGDRYHIIPGLSPHATRHISNAPNSRMPGVF